MAWQHHHPPHPPPPPPYPGMFPGYGEGVDHAAGPDHGFEYGPGAFSAWSGPLGFGGSWGPRGRGGWGFGLGPRGVGRRGRGGGHHPHHHHGGRHHHRDSNAENEDLYDITAAAAAAEADMEATNQAAGDTEMAGGGGGESPATMAAVDDNNNNQEHPDPPEEAPTASCSRGPQNYRRHVCRGRGRGGFGPRRGGGGPPRWWHPGFMASAGGGSGGGGPGPGAPGFLPENLRDIIRQASEAMARFDQQWRQQQGEARGEEVEEEEEGEEDNNSFTPPVDIFDTSDNWTLHVALPGARKEDLGVHWDPARSELVVSGVVHRLGDEAFLAGLVSAERRIGLFERRIPLPPITTEAPQQQPAGPRDEVDADHIQARMQDGILVIIVPKVEKEWTEVKKVDVM